MMKKIVANILFLKACRGTVVGLIKEVFISGDFVSADEPIGTNEIVLGELNRFERAVLTVRNKVIDQHKCVVQKAQENGGRLMSSLKSALAKSHSESEALDNFFWAIVADRIGKSAYDADSLALRAGYKVVAVPSVRQSHSDFGELLLSLLGGAGIGEHEHDCKNCPVRDRCDLPIKQLV